VNDRTARPVSAPAIVVVVAVESLARAFLVCSSYEEQQRLAVELELEQRDTTAEIVEALEQLVDVLADREQLR
jgi:hypothetical protein